MSDSEGNEIVGVRAKWPDEAIDFTPWLSNNLDLLGKTLDMPLELVQTEVPVGPYYLDILAKNPDTGVVVAIENQLEETDHIHLGQLLTYASGQGVGVAIWVAPEFGYEHAQALDQLNRWTGDGIRFYGVKVEVIKNPANSELDARFHKVVYPGGWNKELTRQAWEMPLTTRRYYDFFQPLVNDLRQEGFSDSPRQRFGPSGRHFPSPAHSGIWYAPNMETINAAYVTLHVEMETPGKDQGGIRQAEG